MKETSKAQLKFLSSLNALHLTRFQETNVPNSNNQKPKKGSWSGVAAGRISMRFELFSTKVGTAEEDATEVLRCLWPFLRTYRLFGMFPIAKQGNHLVLRKWRRNPTWLLLTGSALFVQTLMLSTAVRSAIFDEDLWDSINTCIYYGHTLFNSMYMTWVIRKVPGFITKCKTIEILTKMKYCGGSGKGRDRDREDGLVKSCHVLFAIFTVMQFAGNVAYYYSVADKCNVTSLHAFESAFNKEFIKTGGHVTAYTLFFGEFFCDMGWTFADLLLCLMAIILRQYFVRINLAISRAGNSSLENLEMLRIEHRQICGLVEDCNRLFAPLFLLNYVANIGYLFTRLYVGLTDDIDDPNFSVKFESIYAFWFQISFKLLLPSFLAASLHEKATEALHSIHNWPSAVPPAIIAVGTGAGVECEQQQQQRMLIINRFAMQLMTSQVGISGCGYFIISKSFVVTLVSALVTYEIIILQFQTSTH